ncbi:MAG: hypothetical protein H7A45_11205 [Verrucomicrobiales bacterium]|nr:hypothetical protein [Verrucomicrobiales bacterium]MCP5526069.1 hypothetical protein [Verrucomicrobiales bacterium]
MLNPFTQVNWQPDRAEKRRFGLSLIIGFPIFALALFGLRRLLHDSVAPAPFVWLGGIGCAVGVVLYLLPFLARPVYLVWYGLACCIGFVVSNVLLALFYYVPVTAIGLGLRVAGRDSMQRRKADSAASYWHDVKPTADPERYFRQY